MFGLDKERDKIIAENFCNSVGKIRLKLVDDSIVAQIVNKQLKSMYTVKPKLAKEILIHLEQHHPSILNARFNSG